MFQGCSRSGVDHAKEGQVLVLVLWFGMRRPPSLLLCVPSVSSSARWESRSAVGCRIVRKRARGGGVVVECDVMAEAVLLACSPSPTAGMEPIAAEGQNALELLLARGGPTLSEVVADPVLSQAWFRHMVSRFAPEGILFRDAAVAYQEALQAGHKDQVSVLPSPLSCL